MEKLVTKFDEQKKMESPVDAVITEYLKFYIEKREQFVLLKPAIPWKWEDVITEWKFEPDGSKVNGVVYYGHLLSERNKETRISFDMADFPELARISLEDDWLGFFKRVDRKYKYSDVVLAADWARYQLQMDIFMSGVPSAAGRPMVPILVKALYKMHLSQYATQHLQVISGKSFGYYPEMLWWDQRKVYKKWEEWAKSVEDKEGKSETDTSVIQLKD